MPDPKTVEFDDPTTTPLTPRDVQPPVYGPDGEPVDSYRFDDPDNPEFVSSEKIGIVAGGTLLSALIAGCLYHLVAQYYDSFNIVPTLAGVVAGLLLIVAFRQAKLKAKVPIIVCSIAVALLTYFLRYEFTGLADRPYLVRSQVVKRKAAQPDRDESAIRADVEREITPLNVVPVYLDTVAEDGVIVTSSRSGRSRVVRGGAYKFDVLYAIVFCIIGSYYTLNGVLRPKKEGY